MNLIRIFIIFLFCFSCSTTSPGGNVKRDTEEKQKLPVLYEAKSAEGDHLLHLREQDFFDYTENGTFYAGSYSIEGTTLNLAYYNNFQPEGLTNKGTIDKTGSQIVLIAKNRSADRKLLIVTQ